VGKNHTGQGRGARGEPRSQRVVWLGYGIVFHTLGMK
jgi:hypothetical protein